MPHSPRPRRRTSAVPGDPSIPSSPAQQQSHLLDVGSRECDPTNASRGPSKNPSASTLHNAFPLFGRDSWNLQRKKSCPLIIVLHWRHSKSINVTGSGASAESLVDRQDCRLHHLHGTTLERFAV